MAGGVLATCIRKHFSRDQSSLDDETIHSWIDQARDLVSQVAAYRGLRPKDFACTLVAVIARAENVDVALHGAACQDLWGGYFQS